MADEVINQNKIIWKNTYRIASNYPFTIAKKITVDDIEKLGSEQIVDPDQPSVIPYVRVFNESLLSAILQIIDLKFKPLVVVNANDNYQLSGVRNGLQSMECDLYRFTNISSALTEFMYPLKNDMLFCEVTMIKTPDGKVISTPLEFSILLSCPVKQPALISNSNLTESYRNKNDSDLMFSKIENIFKFAINNKYNCLILPDYGCQTEGNPVNKVIEFFNLCIQKYPIKYVFFVIKDLNTPKFNEKNKNFVLFHKHIKR